jgi:hypothetical protein
MLYPILNPKRAFTVAVYCLTQDWGIAYSTSHHHRQLPSYRQLVLASGPLESCIPSMCFAVSGLWLTQLWKFKSSDKTLGYVLNSRLQQCQGVRVRKIVSAIIILRLHLSVCASVTY